jgi:hypothetical protein
MHDKTRRLANVYTLQVSEPRPSTAFAVLPGPPDADLQPLSRPTRIRKQAD